MEPPDSVGEGVQAPQPKRSNVFIYHAVCSAVILLVAVILRAQQTGKTIILYMHGRVVTVSELCLWARLGCVVVDVRALCLPILVLLTHHTI